MATLGQPLIAPESSWRRIDDTLIENTGTGWTKTSNAACWGGSIIEKQTPTAADTFKFTFFGTKIRLIDYKTASRGNRSITIDGVSEIYSCANSTQITQALVYEKLNLQLGYHDVIISSVSGSWFSLDAIDIDSDAKLFSFGYRLNKILLSSGDKYYSATPPIYATDTAIPQMTSNTTPSGIAFASSIFGTDNEPWKAFDRTVGDYYSQNLIKTGHLGYEFSKRVVIGRYTLTANTNMFAPKDWTFEASNDGVNWTVLDTQVNQTWTANNTDKEYTIDINKTNSYKMYRLNWSSNNGGGYVIIREFKMYERMPFNLLKLSNQSEQTFMNCGMEPTINPTQYSGVKSIESNSVAHESGKTYEHTVDMSKRRVDKITLG
ncbi:hypothetical protein [Paenibacillus sp. USHLN196]|uniref:hypothetical protein n=1 Tax=Paenibacillus sp. USHLN196 TaxID=3081291 RepID=UPI0030188C34